MDFFEYKRLCIEKEYNEIFELANYCQQIGVQYKIKRAFDGFQLVFHTGDVIQHFGSYGSKEGCVEFGGVDFEDFNYTATVLSKAKTFVLEYKDYLNSGESTLWKSITI